MASQKIELGKGEQGGLKDLPNLPKDIRIAGQLRKGSGDDDPYTPFKGANAIRAANKDKYGNPEGPQYDLARDGAFQGLQRAPVRFFELSF
jgi:hypothetical protein